MKNLVTKIVAAYWVVNDFFDVDMDPEIRDRWM